MDAIDRHGGERQPKSGQVRPARIKRHARHEEHPFLGCSFQQVTRIDPTDWRAEMALHDELFKQLAYHLPAALTATKTRIEARLAT